MKNTYACITVLTIALLLASFIAGCAPAQESKEIKSGPAPEPVQQSVQEQKVEAPEPAAPTEEIPKEEAPEETQKEAPEEPAMTLEQEDAKARAVAEEFVKGLDGYQSYDGTDFEIKNAFKTGCEGCWMVDTTFVRTNPEFPDETEKIKVNVNLKNWKMDSYTFG